jgi:hypothetical protein
MAVKKPVTPKKALKKTGGNAKALETKKPTPMNSLYRMAPSWIPLPWILAIIR